MIKYHVEAIDTYDLFYKKEDYKVELEKLLNKMGSDDWKLVNIFHEYNSKPAYLIFENCENKV